MALKKYDLHNHTNISRCSVNDVEKVLRRAKKLGLSGIAITDHNQIANALRAQEMNKDLDFEVIIGEEVMTDKGEILCYYLKERIKPGRYEDVVAEVRAQDAVCSIAHPFTGGMRKKAEMDFNEVFAGVSRPDAVETFNARMITKEANRLARELAEKYDLAQTGGSDGHFLFEIGSGRTVFDTEEASDLKEALRKGVTLSCGRKKFPFVQRLLSGFVILFRKVFKRA